ncbi:MAG TPA: MOSC N-terminal beta barrel domain-containing protein [Steroidobacteraceae bacterium]|nr:MOSC N-terminal beta barrel domain-containing protein [Steroidobacteraceae bacterium]
MAVEITSLHTYPVKSCRGLSHQASVLHATGFKWDRHWMFVTEAGRFITQRECGALARVEPAVEGGTLVLRSAGHPELRCPVETSGAPQRVRIWNDDCLAHPVSVDTRYWLEAVAGIRAQLVRLGPGAERVSNSRFTGNDDSRYYLADAFALLITSEASVADLNTRLPQGIPMARFRPNIVVRGLAPYAEDDIERLVIGSVELRLVKPCIRCITTTTDQLTGERDGDEPLRTLRGYRRIASLNGVAFGMNAIIVRGAGETLSVGDRGEVVWREPGAPRAW